MSTKEQSIELPGRIMAELSKSVIGKNDVKRILLVALIAEGHVLIEGLPGTGKTQTGRSFAQVSGCKFKRVQFTPDTMPADVTGFFLYSTAAPPRFIEGPIFANVVLADELNRTTPRTQAALLEAMQEHQVTIETETRFLEKPFMVIATQVHAGAEGTYPLTDVQLDRFMLRAPSEYLSAAEEQQVLASIDYLDAPSIKAVATAAEIIDMQKAAKSVHVSPALIDYIVRLVDELRSDPDVQWGPSTRASISLLKGARAMALLDGRDFVIPDDVKALVYPAVEHRIRVKTEAEMDGIAPRTVIERVLARVAVPKAQG